MKQYCTLQAITDAKTGQVLLQNPKPGTRGSLGRQTLELPGNWSFDAAMSKTMRISESKSIVIRMDATNILNHPVPNLAITNNNAPAGLNINSANPFGFIQDKGNSTIAGSEKFRQFKGVLRFNF